MWRNIRVAILLLVLLWAASHTWLERIMSTGWKEPLWVGIFPVNADGSPAAQSYIDGLADREFADIEDFIAREAHRYGKELEQPVHIAIYPQVKQMPPELEPGSEPDRKPLYPQEKAEIMAGRRALSAQDAQMPVSLGAVVVGPATAAQIRWTRQ